MPQNRLKEKVKKYLMYFQVQYEETRVRIDLSTAHLRHVVMDDTTNVRFIQAHAKRHCGHHDPELSAHEVVLHASPL